MFDDNGSFLLALFEFFIFFAWFMCLWWIFGDLFRSRDLGGFAKTIWCFSSSCFQFWACSST